MDSWLRYRPLHAVADGQDLPTALPLRRKVRVRLEGAAWLAECPRLEWTPTTNLQIDGSVGLLADL